MKILIFILSIVAICWNASAQEISCTGAEASEAEKTASSLHNWEDIHKSFKRFRHCDDGGLAEGYSVSVVRILADRWNELTMLTKLTSSDKDFYTFVLRHIDSTVPKKYKLKKIIINCNKHCPESALELCSSIKKAAEESLSEYR